MTTSVCRWCICTPQFRQGPRGAGAVASEPPPGPCGVSALTLAFCQRHRLSPAETEVVMMAAHGLVTKEIASVREQSAKTVEEYWTRVYAKTRLRTQRDVLIELLRAAATAWGWSGIEARDAVR